MIPNAVDADTVAAAYLRGESAAAIARRVGVSLGVSVVAVASARKYRGIPCWKPPAQEWHALAGKVPDLQIMRQFHVADATVRAYRQRHGIPRWSPAGSAPQPREPVSVDPAPLTPATTWTLAAPAPVPSARPAPAPAPGKRRWSPVCTEREGCGCRWCWEEK